VGNARGLSAVVAGRRRIHLDLPDAEAGVVGIDRSFDELTGRMRGYVPLWRGGYATHVLAVQMSAGAAFGPNAQFGHFGAGGAAGEPELFSGYELFGGGYIFLPVRGYPTSSRAGRFGWSASAEYRFPIALLNWGLGPWPLFFDRILGSVFLDAGNAWEPNPRESPLTAVGAEVTVPLLGFFRSSLELRTGLGVPLVDATQPQLYVRAGLSF
jgi:outer membrane protein assembly factor BamA